MDFVRQALELFECHCQAIYCLIYCREGLEWADIDWVDNGECLDLIEKVNTDFCFLNQFVCVIRDAGT